MCVPKYSTVPWNGKQTTCGKQKCSAINNAAPLITYISIHIHTYIHTHTHTHTHTNIYIYIYIYIYIFIHTHTHIHVYIEHMDSTVSCGSGVYVGNSSFLDLYCIYVFAIHTSWSGILFWCMAIRLLQSIRLQHSMPRLSSCNVMCLDISIKPTEFMQIVDIYVSLEY